MLNTSSKPKVFLVCTGLGHINRGYESFSRECFEALKNNDKFCLYLLKGGGKTTKNEKVVFNLPRKFKLTVFLGKVLNKNPYHVEQFTFCFAMLPLIFNKKPSIIYYSDFILGTFLWHLRKKFHFKYRLLFCNGAPNGAPFKTEDHVQQLLPKYLKDALTKGEPLSKQTLLPYGFNINTQQRLLMINKKEEIKHELGFITNQKIILSVGAINKHHKRMDYIIKEFALLTNEYYLIFLGQFEDESIEIIELAKTLIPNRHTFKNVSQKEVERYYLAADYFVLASLNEGFGRVLVEALSYGLPCLVHDTVTTKEVLKQYGFYIDMSITGELSNYFNKQNEFVPKSELIEAAYQMYSWDKLKDKYADMIINQFNSN